MKKASNAAYTQFGMNTVITHTVFGENADKVIRAARKEAARLENLLSRFRPGSDIGRLNAQAGRKAVKVSSETFDLLSRALKHAERSEGRFDVTVGPLADLWRAAKTSKTPPGDDAVGAALPLVGYKGLHLDPAGKTAFLEKPGQSVDLGGIGKGYAADKVVEVFRKNGIVSAFTNFGGNVAAIGTKPDGSPWRVGIRHPRSPNGLIGAVSVAGRSVVTSGDDQRYFISEDGRRHHHIIDPSTGRPANAGLLSVTVVSDSSAEADALSTAVFAAGLQKGLGLLARYPGAQAVFVDEGLTVYVTAGLEESFQAAENIGINII